MTLAIIGGTGLTNLNGLLIERHEIIKTPFGEPSGPLTFGVLNGQPLVFLARHGYSHHLPPHRINYRANLWALQQAGVRRVIAVAAVGGITRPPCAVVVPDQIVDYTHGREATFFDGHESGVRHIDFTEPYCGELRQALLAAAEMAQIPVHDGGVYGATQGPRLETRAEIERMRRDGCDLVGMTGMPEAVLAAELEICYASLSVVANWAPGVEQGPISMDEIRANLDVGLADARLLIERLLQDPIDP